MSAPSDLVSEAEWLWAAETNRVPSLCVLSPGEPISASWGGCAALLGNPQSDVPQTLFDGWAERVSREKHYDANERRLVDPSGTLLIGWPNISDGGGPVPVDLLLATSNDPESAYPTPEEIANAWNREPADRPRNEYFRRNRDNGIYTFEDQEIERLLVTTH